MDQQPEYISEAVSVYWGVGSLGLVAVFTLWLLNRYAMIFPNKKLRQPQKSHVSLVTVVVTYISWVFGFATIAVLPVDIALSSNPKTNPASLSLLHGFWVIFYWCSMILSYLMIPWLMGYEISGEFNERERIKSSLFQTLWFYVYLALGGSIFLTTLWFKGLFSMSDSSGGFTVRGFLMALGGAAGLLQIIVFLGYGLISVPKAVKFRTNNKSRFDVSLCRIDQYEDQLQQARLTVEDTLANALGLRNMQIVRDVELMARLNELILRFPSELLDSTTPYTSFDHIEEIYKKGDYSALVQLNQRTKEALLDLDRKVTTYQHAVEEALSLEEAEFQF